VKTLPHYALVLIALASGVLAVLLFGSLLSGLVIALVVPLALAKPVPITKLSAALALGIVAGDLSSYALAAVDGAGAGAGKVYFAGSLAVMALFTSLHLLALRKQQSADVGAQQAALSLQPPSGRALVIVHRQGFAGYGNAVGIALDGRAIAQLGMGRFTAFDVAPGTHRLGAAVATIASPGRPSELEVELAAGQTAVFHASFSFAIARLLQGQVDLVRDPDPAAVAHALAGRTMVAAGTLLAETQTATPR
jgi:hypothetical protein